MINALHVAAPVKLEAVARGIPVYQPETLRTPEARAMAAVATRYRPQVVLDMHEFTAGERWIKKFGGWTSTDVMLQSAMTGNLSPEIAQAGLDVFLPVIRRAVQAEGLDRKSVV